MTHLHARGNESPWGAGRFGALTARSLGADYQINAYSGLGMVRNYNGTRPEVDYRTYYDRALQDVSADTWRKPDRRRRGGRRPHARARSTSGW